MYDVMLRDDENRRNHCNRGKNVKENKFQHSYSFSATKRHKIHKKSLVHLVPFCNLISCKPPADSLLRASADPTSYCAGHTYSVRNPALIPGPESGTHLHRGRRTCTAKYQICRSSALSSPLRSVPSQLQCNAPGMRARTGCTQCKAFRPFQDRCSISERRGSAPRLSAGPWDIARCNWRKAVDRKT